MKFSFGSKKKGATKKAVVPTPVLNAVKDFVEAEEEAPPPVKPTVQLTTMDDGKQHLAVIQETSANYLPSLECSTCVIGTPACVEYKEGYACFYEEKFATFNTRDVTGILDQMHDVMRETLRRWRMALLMEKTLSQGATNPEATRLGAEVFAMLQQLAEFKRVTQTIKVTQEGKDGGGIISRLFGGGQMKEQPIELNPGEQTVLPAMPAASDGSKITIELTNKPALDGSR